MNKAAYAAFFLCYVTQSMDDKTKNIPSFALYLILAIAVTLIYYPGLSSGFQLDDLHNLAALASVDNGGLLPYLVSGIDYPSGRPVSLFTFALQSGAWPDSPFAFKVVNLLMHLLCGGLIFIICRQLLPYLRLNDKQGLVFSSLVAGLWLVHPLQLTTVLYVVQRMTQLATLFTLSGISLYLYFRQCYLRQPVRRWLWYLGLSVWWSLLMAVFSKENGLLLPLFIVVLNYTLLRQDSANQALQVCTRIVLGVPLVIMLGYLAVGFNQELASYAVRSFSMTERLLTEARVLLDYLVSILLPHPAAYSLYHDDIVISRGLLTPPQTLPAVICIGLLLWSALRYISRFPVYAFAVLWFLSGHVLESSYINLELYFEHRNYLPLLGPLFLLVYLLLCLQERRPVIAGLALVVVILGVVGNTLWQVQLWQDPVRHHRELVESHPTSPRARVALGNLLIARGDITGAEAYYQDMQNRYPGDIYPRLKRLAIMACIRGQEPSADDWQRLVNSASAVGFSSFGVSQELVTLSAAVNEGDCTVVDINHLIRLVVTLALNPAYRSERAVLHETAARLGIRAGDGGVAYNNITEAVRISPRVPRQVLKFRILLALGQEAEARQQLIALQNRIDKRFRLGLIYSGLLPQLERELEDSLD